MPAVILDDFFRSQFMSQKPQTIIIGGGIIGLLTAKELSKQDAQITLIDKGLVGQESSWAAGGILLPLYPWQQPDAITALCIGAPEYYQQLASQLHHATGIDSQCIKSGMLITQNADLNTVDKWCKRWDMPYLAATNAMLSSLPVSTKSPIFLPQASQIRNPRLLKALKIFLQGQGVRFIENCNISGCQTKNQRIASLQTSVGDIAAKNLILCAGAWNTQIATTLGITPQPDIKPVKGQMLLFAAQPATLPHIILHGNNYLIPRQDGKILAGSSIEHSQFDKQTTTTAANQLQQFACNLLPQLTQCKILHHWAGLRPASPQGIPSIGCHPQINNLYANTGHYRNGIAMAPASAKLLADLLQNRQTSIDLTPYAL